MKRTIRVDLEIEAPDRLVNALGWEAIVEALDEELGNQDVFAVDGEGNEVEVELRGITFREEVLVS